jgi:tetratricopeptide (TPR) repeat protein
MSNLKKCLHEYIFDTENFLKNYKLALEYLKLKQLPVAITFFLRCAERTNEKDIAYVCLIMIAICFDEMGRRNNTVITTLKRAICFLPKRPEAYYVLSNFYEKNKEYLDGYFISHLALNTCDFNIPRLEVIKDYYGECSLIFEKAICSWWIGKEDESRSLFYELKSNHWNYLDQIHKDSVNTNLLRISVRNNIKENLKNDS